MQEYVITQRFVDRRGTPRWSVRNGALVVEERSIGLRPKSNPSKALFTSNLQEYLRKDSLLISFTINPFKKSLVFSAYNR